MTQKTLFNSLLNEEVYKTGQVKHFEAGSVIQNIHTYIRFIPIVLSGIIKVIERDDEGQDILLYYMKPGESCIMSFLAGIHKGTSKIMAVVEEDAQILLIPVDKANEWISKFPEWTDYIFTLYQKRFEELLDVVNAIAFHKMDTRLLHLLKQKSHLTGSDIINVTHQQLADDLGTTREAVSRVLKQMENSGLISLSRNKISLL